MDKNDDTLLARWLDGTLGEEELTQLKSSPEYPTLLRMKENFARLQSPRTDSERILEHVLRQPKTTARRVPIFRIGWAVAAAVALIFGLAAYFALPREFTAANGQSYAFALPDDSKVLLNAGSNASYSRWRWDNTRRVDLEGEAYFKVAKGKKFVVVTSVGNVTVLGTQFNVRARPGRFDVVCYEGKVLVEHQSQRVVLSPGQKVTFDADKLLGIGRTKSSEPEWIKKELVFENESLEGVLSEIERQYAVSITTDLRSEQRFSGSVPGDDLTAALKIIAHTYHLEMGGSEKSIVLKSAK